MSPRPTRRRVLQAAAAVGLTAVAGCNGLSGQGSATVRNEGRADAYDFLVRHDFDYQPPGGEPLELELRLKANELATADDLVGEVVYEETLQLQTGETTRRLTDAFDESPDAEEFVVGVELEALISEPITEGEEVIDEPSTTADDIYRFEPGSGRDPENGTFVVTTAADTAELNKERVEVVDLDTVATLTETPGAE